MTPTAVTVHDQETMTALARAGFTRKADPKFALIAQVALCAVSILLLDILFVILRFKQGSMPFSAILILIASVQILRYVSNPKALYEGQGKYKNLKITYTFLPDRMTTYSAIPGSTSHNVTEYNMLYAVKETTGYFFVYRNPASAYVVDKAHLYNCDADTVRQLLLSGGAKYVLCSY